MEITCLELNLYIAKTRRLVWNKSITKTHVNFNWSHSSCNIPRLWCFALETVRVSTWINQTLFKDRVGQPHYLVNFLFVSCWSLFRSIVITVWRKKYYCNKGRHFIGALQTCQNSRSDETQGVRSSFMYCAFPFGP